MPTTTGLPGARGVHSTTVAVTQSTPGTLERVLQGSAFTLSGPHNGGAITIKVSQYQPLCAKNVTLALYIDGMKTGTWVQGMTADSSAGTDRTYTFAIPWENRAVTRRYWITWTTPCGTGDLVAGSRVMTFSPTAPDQNRPFGMASGFPDTPRRDGFAGPRLPGWWRPIVSAGIASPAWKPYGGIVLTPTATNARMQGWAMRVPPLSFTIEALMADVDLTGGGGGNDIRAGIFTMTSGGAGWVCGPFHQNSGAGAIGVTTTSVTADWSAYNGVVGSTATAQQLRLMWYRLRFSRAASTLDLQYSIDRLTWTNVISQRTSVAQPTHVGFGIYSNTPGLTKIPKLLIARWGLTFP